MDKLTIGSCTQMLKLDNTFSLCLDYVPLDDKDSKKAIQKGIYLGLILLFLIT